MTTLARMSPVTMPAGRWVARTRWTPSERPVGSDAHEPVDEVGQLGGEKLNSSTTMTRRASRGTDRAPCARRRAR